MAQDKRGSARSTIGDRSCDRLCRFGKCVVHDWCLHPSGWTDDRGLILGPPRGDDQHAIHIEWRKIPMANVVKKYSISYELAQKMVDAAVVKARELGVSENVAILDDGGNLKAFGRMDGAPIPTTEMAQNKAYTALLGVSTQEFFKFIQSDPSLLAGIPTLARMAAWGGGFPIKVNGEVVGAIGVSGAPTVQNDIDCAKAALALVSDAVPTK